jgi:general secretion pathway protein G
MPRDEKRRTERGMTHIEIMVVLTIIGLIAAAVSVNVIKSFDEARVKQAKADLHTI